MNKRFILLGDGLPGDPIDTVAADCAAVYALNHRLSSDDEVREELMSYGMPTVTAADISKVRRKFDQMTSASESDIQHATLLSEDELIARVVRSRDRRPATPLVIEDIQTKLREPE